MDAIGGRHRIYVNSQRYYLKGDPSYDVGGLVQTVAPGLDLVALKETKNATVLLECPNGQKIVFPNASFVEDQTVSGSEGEVTFKFAGDGPAKPIMP